LLFISAEIVAPVSAHAAFQKGAQMLKMRIKMIALDEKSFKVDLKAMRKAITANTVMLVGSACGYPHGIIDDIEEIAKVWVHSILYITY
jgi:sphinganine-1-phosphate aldolase